MSKSLTSELSSSEAELQTAIEKIFGEVAREHEKMKEEQREIDRLKARTRAILARLKTA